jgi:CubicO group peptidase (beta-lactamase class C family)
MLPAVGMSRTVLGILTILIGWLTSPVSGADRVWPSREWAKTEDPAALGWSIEKIATAREYTRAYDPTAVMIVQDGKVLASWGDVAHKANIRSARKTLLSALYGIGVAEGTIALDKTLGALGIDDRAPSLSESEKQATIRDLLMMRSGVYHAAAYEGPGIAERRPRRGSHPPGGFWYYNNWDVNTLGVIYEKLVRSSVFENFENRIAKPIGMEDLTESDGAAVFDPSSDYPAYTFRLTVRDLARFGWLFLNRGLWSADQIIPAEWIDESTRPWSRAETGLDYGYLWWVLRDEATLGHPSLAGAYMALGYGGQAVAVVPLLGLVVAQLIDVPEGQERIGGPQEFVELLHLIASAASSHEIRR